jgi:hypothetical protein
MYVLVCDQPVTNNTCETGFRTVALETVLPPLMTYEEFQQLAPGTILFLVTCAGWRILRNR